MLTPGSLNLDWLDKLNLVRMLRFARLARIIRLPLYFRTLWLLISGLLHSLKTIIWTLTVITILIYVYGLIGVELLRQDPGAGQTYNDIVGRHFKDIPSAFL